MHFHRARAESAHQFSQSLVTSLLQSSHQSAPEYAGDDVNELRWTPLLRPRGAIFKLVFGEVCSGYFFVVFVRASNHLERESDRANALTAPSSRL
jgi:hypothetical protein